MKHILTFLLCIPILHAEENPPPLNEGYAHGEYTFSGKVETEMGGFTSVHTFSGKATKDMFECSWENDIGFMKSGGSVSVDGDGGSMSMSGVEDSKFDDPEMAIASATGVSGGSARFMHSLWKGDGSSVFPTENVKITKEDGKTMVSGSNGTRKSVVTLKGGMVVSVEEEYDPAQDKEIGNREEMTDDQIKELLKTMNKPDTEEEIEKIKVMMKQADETMAKMKDKILTVTTIKTEGIAPQD